MKYNHKFLYRAVAENNMQEAKKIVLRDCEECGVKSDKPFCDEIASRIRMRPEMIELPANLYGLCYKEIPEISFNTNQYYISKRENEIMDRIQAILSTSKKLQNAGINFRRSLLLTGESGAGKTEFVRYIAYHYKFPLYIVSISGIVDSYMGGTGKNLAKIFNQVNKDGDCILFLDELDAICSSRSSINGSCDKELSRATMAIVQELDRMNPCVFLCAATNLPENLDTALLRRFTLSHQISKLNDTEKAEMIKQYLYTVKEKASFEMEWSDIEIIDFCKGSDLSNAKLIELLIEHITQAVMNDDKYIFRRSKNG